MDALLNILIYLIKLKIFYNKKTNKIENNIH